MSLTGLPVSCLCLELLSPARDFEYIYVDGSISHLGPFRVLDGVGEESASHHIAYV